MMKKRPGGSYLQAKPKSKPQLIHQTKQKGDEAEAHEKKVEKND